MYCIFITCSTESLIGVIITYKDIPVLSIAVVEINIGEKNRRTKMVVRRQFTHNSIEQFKHLLSKEVWTDVYKCLDVNCSLEAVWIRKTN